MWMNAHGRGRPGLAATVQSRMAGVECGEGDGEGDEAVTSVQVQQSREAYLGTQEKTCNLYIAPYATHPIGLNPLLSKSVFQPL